MKKRIDILLHERGLAKSREKAKAQVMAGVVFAGSVKVKNASDKFEEDVRIDVKSDPCPYVSRGGLKLERAILDFNIELGGKVCADIGASTGGFTDVMLKNGAAEVYAVDVGYGQFDYGLRNDPRVRLLERTNARYLEAFELPVDFVTIDVSFISLSLILPAAVRISGHQADIVCLIKPQFEAGREQVGKKGVVKDSVTHAEVIRNVFLYAEREGLSPVGLSHSPVKGPNGNIEFLARFKSADNAGDVIDRSVIDFVVEQAHEELR